MTDKIADDLSKKMNVLIALSLRQLLGDRDFSSGGKRKKGGIWGRLGPCGGHLGRF